jgi:hypothetical protein
MKNHWLQKAEDIPTQITKEIDKEIIAELKKATIIKDMIKCSDALDIIAIENAMDDRKIIKLTYFGKQPKDVEFKPFMHEISSRVMVDVESGKLTGKISDRYSTDDGHNWYVVTLDRLWNDYEVFTFAEFRIQIDNSLDGYNIIPEYFPGRPRWFSPQYNVSAVANPQVTLNPDTFLPQETLDIKLKIQYDGQHDGRLWTEQWKKDCDRRLIEEIMSDIKKQVEDYVSKINPFSIHC